MSRLVLALVIGCAAVAAGHAQWLGYSEPGAPRLPNGKVDLSAQPPRTSDGTPDLSGVWQTQLESTDGKQNAFSVPGDDLRTFSKYMLNILADFKADDVPMRPLAVETMQENRDILNRRGADIPSAGGKASRSTIQGCTRSLGHTR